jgi:cephalosporin-C deacetylase
MKAESCEEERMPIFDLPLSELREYQGVNPCPENLAEYWNNAMEELKGTEPAVKLIPAEFRCPGAECFDLYFTGVGGARIHAKYLRPEGGVAPHPAVLMFHGYSGDSGDWVNKLAYVKAGMSVAAMDVRGQGGKSEELSVVRGNTLNGHIIRGLSDGPEKLLFRAIYLDCAQLARIVMSFSEVDAARVGACGGSQGGGLTLACAALTPGLNRAAPQFPFLCDFKRVWDMDLDVAAYAELREYFRRFDPLHKREQEIFTRLGYIDLQHLASRIRAKVRMYTGLMDTICPPSTQFAAYNKMVCEKSVVIYPDFGHEWLPGAEDDTFTFMLEMIYK